MKILYITSFFPPERIAGAELGTFFMARHMAGLGHEVEILVTRPNTPVYRREQRDGFIVHWMPYLNISGLRFFSEISQGLRKIKEICPDIIHGNCLLPGGYLAMLAAKRFKAKSVVLCYGYDIADMKVWQAGLFGKAAMQGADLLLSATDYCAELIREKWKINRKIERFYAGYDDSVFPECEYHQPEEKKRLLFIGRMIPEKGFTLLIDIMERLPSHYHLQVIGTGVSASEYKAEIEKRGLSQRVEFSGMVPNVELSAVFAKSDLFVLPSKREPFGVVCIEAIASGVPVLCSDAMGLPEAVKDGRNGRVMKTRDSGKWANALQELVTDLDLRDRIYKNSLEDRKKWAWSQRLEALEQHYHQLMK